MEEELKVRPFVLAGIGLVEGVGTGSEVVDPPEDPGAAGAAEAGLGLL